MATAKKITPVKASNVKGVGTLAKLNTVDLSAPAKKAVTKADLEVQVKSLTGQLKNSEDLRIAAVQYRDKLSMEMGDKSRRVNELLVQVTKLQDTLSSQQAVHAETVKDVERLLTENKAIAEANTTLERSKGDAWLEHSRTSETSKRIADLLSKESATLAAREEEVLSLTGKLSKIPGWIRYVFSA